MFRRRRLLRFETDVHEGIKVPSTVTVEDLRLGAWYVTKGLHPSEVLHYRPEKFDQLTEHTTIEVWWQKGTPYVAKHHSVALTGVYSPEDGCEVYRSLDIARAIAVALTGVDPTVDSVFHKAKEWYKIFRFLVDITYAHDTELAPDASVEERIKIGRARLDAELLRDPPEVRQRLLQSLEMHGGRSPTSGPSDGVDGGAPGDVVAAFAVGYWLGS